MGDASSEPKANDSEDRDDRGRYLEGHAIPGPGRPKGYRQKDAEQRFLTLADLLSPERWKKICESQIKKAENGDEKAIEWVSKHVLVEAYRAHRLAVDEAKLEVDIGDGDADDQDIEIRIVVDDRRSDAEQDGEVSDGE